MSLKKRMVHSGLRTAFATSKVIMLGINLGMICPNYTSNMIDILGKKITNSMLFMMTYCIKDKMWSAHVL